MVGRQTKIEERLFGGNAIIYRFAFGKKQTVYGRNGRVEGRKPQTVR